MIDEPMTDVERDSYVQYAIKFGHAWGNRLEWLREDLVGASSLGLAIALASPDLPRTCEERRKFVGQTCWNMMRREMTRYLKPQPIVMSDLAEEFRAEIEIVAEHVARVDWLDEYDAIARSLDGIKEPIFRLTFGDLALTHAEVGAEVGIAESTVRYHLKHIKRAVRNRLKRED